MLSRLLRQVFGRGARPAAVRPASATPAAEATNALPVALVQLLEQGRAAQQAGLASEAVAAFETALQQWPAGFEAVRAAVLVNLGAALREQARMAQAIERLREAVALQPGLAAAHYNLGLCLYEIGNVEAAEVSLDAALALAPDFQPAQSTRLCVIGLGRKYGPERVLEEHRRWARRFADPLTAAATPHSNDRSIGRRLTVGYVSADFREHSVAHFIAPILAQHDRERFRVIGYDNWPRGDATTARLRASADEWRRIDSLDDDQAAGLVRSDGVDILVDLSGHTLGNRLMMFARKPAPVQVSWLGYMCTTGMAAMDWRITDRHLDPTDASDGWYSERLLRIACSAAFEPHPDSPPVNAPPSASSGFVRFGSLNNYAKIGDEVIALWARMLAELPSSRLLLVAMGGDDAQTRSAVHERFERLAPVAGISSRVDVIGRRPIAAFLRLFHDIDIALDPFPYGGGTTTLHTLWMGVPVVTLEGESELSRSTSGMLHACGLPELVARSEAGYLDICEGLVFDARRLSSLRMEIRERLSKSFIGNAGLVTRSLEEGYAHIWADYVLHAAGPQSR